MFQPDPRQRLWLINQRNADLIDAAEQHRLAKSHPEEPANHLRGRLRGSARASLRRAFADIRRSMSAPAAPCEDPAPTVPC
jgi:hypothetical protein